MRTLAALAAVAPVLPCQPVSAQIDLALSWPTPDTLYFSRITDEEDRTERCAASGFFAVAPSSGVIRSVWTGEDACELVPMLDGAAISRDGAFIIGKRVGTGPVRVDLASAQEVPLGPRCHGQWYWPDISADGQRIAFGAKCSDSIPHEAIYAIPSTGGVPHAIASDWGYDATTPQWSRDGQWVTYTRRLPLGTRPSAPAEVVVVRIDGTAHRVLDRGEFSAWSPDGQWIAYRSSGGGIAIIRADGSERREVLRRDGSGQDQAAGTPVWSPDGGWIAFTRAHRGEAASLWRVNVASGEMRRVTRFGR
jgi:Tol biopolymer transport system component